MAQGSARPGSRIVAKLSRQQPREIAQRKLPDLDTDDLAAAMRQVAGTARSISVLSAEDE